MSMLHLELRIFHITSLRKETYLPQWSWAGRLFSRICLRTADSSTCSISARCFTVSSESWASSRLGILSFLLWDFVPCADFPMLFFVKEAFRVFFLIFFL